MTDDLILNYSSVPSEVSWAILRSIWTASKYLIGSTSKTIPYELVFALTDALKDWDSRDNLITTALIDECNFYFQGIDPNFKILVKSYLSLEITHDLIQIALPRIYIHKPLYSIPLYHELGHFIDFEKRITHTSFLLNPLTVAIPPKDRNIEIAYRKEFFADLFSASYTGGANIIFLNEFAPNQPASNSHPATSQRIEVLEAFLQGKHHETIDIFQSALNKLGLPLLSKRFKLPDLYYCYNNIRPYCIKTKEELHGILEAGWNYQLTLKANSDSALNDITDEFEPARIINDLTEKSIRNMILNEKWNNGTVI